MFRQACLDSGVPKNLLGANFKDWFGEEKDKRFANKILKSILGGKKINFVLLGDYDSGKSYFSVCIIKRAIKNRLSSRIIEFKEMMDLFEGKRYKDIFYEQYRKLRKHHVIIIDGINEEVWRSYGDWTRVTFVQLINRFIDDSEAKLIILNIDLEEMEKDTVSILVDRFGYHFSKMVTRNFVPYKLRKIKTSDEKWSEILDVK